MNNHVNKNKLKNQKVGIEPTHRIVYQELTRQSQAGVKYIWYKPTLMRLNK